MVSLFNRGKKRKLIFLERKGDNYTFISEKMVDPNLEAYALNKEKTFAIDPSKTVWDGGPIIYDIGNVTPINLEKLETEDKKRPQDLTAYLKSSALNRLVNGNMLKWLLIIGGLGLLACVITGGWGIWNMNNANKQLYDLSLKYLNATLGGTIKLK